MELVALVPIELQLISAFNDNQLNRWLSFLLVLKPKNEKESESSGYENDSVGRRDDEGGFRASF